MGAGGARRQGVNMPKMMGSSGSLPSCLVCYNAHVVYGLQDVQRKLAAHEETLRSFGVLKLLLFGSVSRDQASAQSDLDFLVELHPKTFRNYMGLKLFLEELFDCKVDLVTLDGLKPVLKERVIAEAKRVS
jgi:uncharacterized protein